MKSTIVQESCTNAQGKIFCRWQLLCCTTTSTSGPPSIWGTLDSMKTLRGCGKFLPKPDTDPTATGLPSTEEQMAFRYFLVSARGIVPNLFRRVQTGRECHLGHLKTCTFMSLICIYCPSMPLFSLCQSCTLLLPVTCFLSNWAAFKFIHWKNCYWYWHNVSNKRQ